MTDTTALVGLGSWPAARNLDIMETSLERPAGPLGGPAAPAPCTGAADEIGEAAVALSDDDPVVVVVGVADVVLGVAGVVLAVAVEGVDRGDVVRPSEVCPGDPGLCCCCMALMSMALPLPPGGPFPPGGTDAILNVGKKSSP